MVKFKRGRWCEAVKVLKTLAIALLCMVLISVCGVPVTICLITFWSLIILRNQWRMEYEKMYAIKKIKHSITSENIKSIIFPLRKRRILSTKQYIPRTVSNKSNVYNTLSIKFKRLKKSRKEFVGYPSSLLSFS